MATVLALDIGTSSVRAQRFAQGGEPTGGLRRAAYDSGNAEEVAGLVRSLLDGEEPDGTSSFGHSLVAVDSGWRPVEPILGWGLAQTTPEVFRRAAHFVSFADFVRGEPVTGLSLASGTGLLDLATGDWDDELLGVLGLERERLPQTPALPVWIDAACSNLGAGCTGRERAALMVGTSGALRVLYETERPQPKPGLFLYALDGRRVVEGGALSDG